MLTLLQGSGKTFAFGVPIVHQLLIDLENEGIDPVKPKKSEHPRALLIAPTRELALQVANQMKKLLKYTRINVT